MRNKVIILMILVIPLAVFAFLQATTKDYAAVAVQKEALGKGKLIKFYSPMCSECKTVGDSVSNAMKDYNETILYEEVNVSNKDRKTKNMISDYKITVVPTVIFLDKDGNIVKKSEGAIEEVEIKNQLDEIK